MLVKLAIYILRKSKQSVVINCDFNKPIDVNVSNNLQIHDNNFQSESVFYQGQYRTVLLGNEELENEWTN